MADPPAAKEKSQANKKSDTEGANRFVRISEFPDGRVKALETSIVPPPRSMTNADERDLMK